MDSTGNRSFTCIWLISEIYVEFAPQVSALILGSEYVPQIYRRSNCGAHVEL